jgi:hypothetical protein
MEEIKKEKKYPSGITAEIVADAKAKFGDDKIKMIDLPKDDESNVFLTVLATVPSRTIVSNYRRFAESDPKKAEEILVKNCLLTHKDEVLADDGLFYGALYALAELIPVRKGIIKNC